MSDETPTDAPQPQQMVLTVIYDSGLDERVLAVVTEAGAEGWTKIDDAQGYGGTGYKLNTPVWPGMNNILLVALSREQAVTISSALHALQASHRRKPGITLWLQPVEVL